MEMVNDEVEKAFDAEGEGEGTKISEADKKALI